MKATEVFPPEVLADICATARENHAHSGRGVLFVKPMPDGSGLLDSQYFQACQLLTLAPLNELAGCNLVAVASQQVAACCPDRQCVLLWMGDDEKIYCETIDDPNVAG
jgi:hypothetical protein